MRENPFSDTLSFLTTGGWTTVVFWLLLLASLGIAFFNYRRDARQRSALHLWNWLSRLFIGAMWWQQSLWKLPPTYTDQPDGSGGLRYWMEQMVHGASFAAQADFVKKIVLPHFSLFCAAGVCRRSPCGHIADAGFIHQGWRLPRRTDGGQSLAGTLPPGFGMAMDLFFPDCDPDHVRSLPARAQPRFGRACAP